MPKITTRQADTVREAIKGSQLVNRLQSHAFGIPEISKELAGWLETYAHELSTEAADELREIWARCSVKMEASQVKAAEALLRKVLPDLKATEHTGELNLPVSGTVNFVPSRKE